MKYFTGIFLLLHGLVHLLYMGHSLNYFELQTDFRWPEDSVFLRRVFSTSPRKRTAAVLCISAALDFIVSGIFVLTGHSWYRPAILMAVSLSTLLFVAFWDGSIHQLLTQGGIALLINLLILVYILA